jgi:GntR family transcriptional regulator
MTLTIDPTSPTPAYQQIELHIAERIRRGRLDAGDRLAPERELAESLGVSRMTVRQAYEGLERRGLIERGVGRGTFVSAPKLDLDHRSHVAGFSEQIEAAGLEPGAELLLRERRAPSDEARVALALGENAAVLHARRLRFAGGVPLAIEDFWLPLELFPGIDELDLSGSIYELMRERYGRAPVRAVERLEPIHATAPDARALNVRPRSPLMLVERIAYDADGTPIEFARDRHRGDRARFVIEVAPRGNHGDGSPRGNRGDGASSRGNHADGTSPRANHGDGTSP